MADYRVVVDTDERGYRDLLGLARKRGAVVASTYVKDELTDVVLNEFDGLHDRVPFDAIEWPAMANVVDDACAAILQRLNSR